MGRRRNRKHHQHSRGEYSPEYKTETDEHLDTPYEQNFDDYDNEYQDETFENELDQNKASLRHNSRKKRQSKSHAVKEEYETEVNDDFEYPDVSKGVSTKRNKYKLRSNCDKSGSKKIEEINDQIDLSGKQDKISPNVDENRNDLSYKKLKYESAPSATETSEENENTSTEPESKEKRKHRTEANAKFKHSEALGDASSLDQAAITIVKNDGEKCKINDDTELVQSDDTYYEISTKNREHARSIIRKPQRKNQNCGSMENNKQQNNSSELRLSSDLNPNSSRDPSSESSYVNIYLKNKKMGLISSQKLDQITRSVALFEEREARLLKKESKKKPIREIDSLSSPIVEEGVRGSLNRVKNSQSAVVNENSAHRECVDNIDSDQVMSVAVEEPGDLKVIERDIIPANDLNDDDIHSKNYEESSEIEFKDNIICTVQDLNRSWKEGTNGPPFNFGSLELSRENIQIESDEDHFEFSRTQSPSNISDIKHPKNTCAREINAAVESSAELASSDSISTSPQRGNHNEINGLADNESPPSNSRRSPRKKAANYRNSCVSHINDPCKKKVQGTSYIRKKNLMQGERFNSSRTKESGTSNKVKKYEGGIDSSSRVFPEKSKKPLPFSNGINERKDTDIRHAKNTIKHTKNNNLPRIGRRKKKDEVASGIVFHSAGPPVIYVPIYNPAYMTKMNSQFQMPYNCCSNFTINEDGLITNVKND